jgi:hypothetical protein
VMQEYDNSARRAYGQAALFASQEPVADEDPAIREDRRKAYRSLQDFEYGRQLLGEAVRVLGPLRDRPQPIGGPAEQGFLDELVQCGQKFVRLTTDARDAKVKYSEEAQHGYGTSEYMRAMASGSVSAAVARYATRMSARIEPLERLRDRADLAYCDLCTALREHHNLPPLPRIGS